MKYPSLYARISALADVPESEWLRAESLGKEEVLPKRGRFLSAGDPADRVALVLRGLFRAYRVSAEGVESVKAFRAEGEMLGAYAERLQSLPSLTYVEALEPSTILVFRTKDLDLLEATHPSWIMLARRVAEHHFLLKERREQEFLELDAEGRLVRFWEEHPHLEGRVAQVEVAAYLGITPVALSRIVSRRRGISSGQFPSSLQVGYAHHSNEVIMKRSGATQEGESASQLISKRIAELGDWRGETLGRIRALIKEADPEILEEWKWRGTPVWSHNGMVCTGETYKNVVKMTFAKGASLKDPAGLFNSSLDGNTRRAIDIHEGEEIDARALKALIRAAVALNVSRKKAAPPKRKGR